jgi:protein SCO1/2
MREASARRKALLGCSLAFVAFVCSLVALCARPASAHDFDLKGLVLAVDAAKGRAVIRFEPTIDLPSRVTTFAIEPARDARKLRIGATVTGTGDDDGASWTLRHVVVTGSQDVTGATADASVPTPAQILRNVHHLNSGEPVPATHFVDQDGKPFDFAMLRGEPAILSFVYTRCADVRMCPLISAKFHALQEKLRDEKVRLVEVTLDPAYDRGAALARYARTFGADPARWTLATGDPEAVLNFAAQFQVTAFPDERIGLIHAERTVLVDRDGTIRQLIDETSWSPDELIAQLHDNERLASNPFLRFNLWLSSRASALCGNAVSGFSGVRDLVVVLGIFAAFGYALYRFARNLSKSPS